MSQPDRNPPPDSTRHGGRPICVPYGLAFEIAELLEVGAWARGRAYVMNVALDQVRGGAEFEEMLMLCEPGRKRRRMHLWRTEKKVFTQIPGSAPRGFETIREALDAQGAAPPRRGGLLGLFRAP